MVRGDVGHDLRPFGEGRLHARIGPRDLAVGEVHVELIAVDAQVHVVEDAGARPQRLGAGGQAVDAGGLELLAVGDELGPVLGLAHAGLLVGVLVVVDAPLIIGVGHAPLLAVDGHRGGGGLQLVVEAVGFPHIVNRLEQAGLDEGRHAVAGIPGGDVRRVGGQEVADGGLVAFVVEVVPLDVDVRIRRLEIGDQLFHRLLRRGVGLVGVDDEFARQRGRGGKGKGESEAKQAFHECH